MCALCKLIKSDSLIPKLRTWVSKKKKFIENRRKGPHCQYQEKWSMHNLLVTEYRLDTFVSFNQQRIRYNKMHIILKRETISKSSKLMNMYSLLGVPYMNHYSCKQLKVMIIVKKKKST